MTDGGTVPMFTTPTDAPSARWSTASVVTPVGVGGLTNNGEADTRILVTTDSDDGSTGFQVHEAAQYCYDLVAHGSDDWYLPSHPELGNLCSNSAEIGNFTTTGGGGVNVYWSTEQDSGDPDRANMRRFSNCGKASVGKGANRKFRCVRKGPAPRCANPYGVEGDMVYNNATGVNVMQYCDGARWIAIGKWE
jgi:hypothetical protein